MFNQLAQVMYDRQGYRMMEHDNGWFGLAGFVLFMLVIVVLSILAYRLIYTKQVIASGNSQNAIEIAKLRYAKGEITKAEFSEIKKELGE